MEEKDKKDELLSKSVTPEALEINKKLIAAFKAGPTATREFLDSEEGMSDACREILRKPWVDNDPDDDVVSVTDAPDTVVTELIPTQRFIDLMQSVSFPLSQLESADKKSGLLPAIQSKKGFGTIVISKSSEGTLIIDGHHRWSGIFGIAPDGKIDAKLVNWPGVNAKEKLASAQIAIAGWKGSGPQPSKGGEPKFNILGKPAEEIKKMILDNVNNPEVVDPEVKEFGGLLNDKMIEDIIGNPEIIFNWAGIEEGEKDVKVIRETIATKVSNNLSKMKNFVEGAPPREDMPQFDPDIKGPDFKEIEPDLKAGKYNVSPTFFESKYIRTFESFVKSKRK